MSAPTKVRLGEYLVAEGYISPSQLALALEEKQRNHKRLGETLVDLDFVSESIITQFVAQDVKTDTVNFSQIQINTKAIDAIPYHIAKRYKVLPIDIDDERITVAMADIYNVVAIDVLEKTCGLPVHGLAAAESELLETLEYSYIQEGSLSETISKIINQTDILNEDSESSPLIRLVDQLIVLGIRSQATDIHIEPEENSLRVRMRRDGMMHEECLMPAQLKDALTARLKIMANMDVTEKRIPQDGRIRFQISKRKVDLRVSSLPTQHGESIVIRVLDATGKKVSLQNIGFSNKALQQFKKALDTPHGVILVTGPTGSGKTTTLYAAIEAIDSRQRSVFTLEDPVEYAMPGIRQVQVDPEVGMSFAAGLRSLLRQDPDVILVGEIRDPETASLAIRAALTGHAVFSTLHTNDAIGAIPRLIDMGIEPYLLPSALVAIVAQRLVRKLCLNCKHPIDDEHNILEELGIKHSPNTQLWQAKGCDACNHSGYSGRMAIYEVLNIDESFHDAIMGNANRSEILQLAKNNGMQSLLEDGINKAMQGHTSIEEVLRVVK